MTRSIAFTPVGSVSDADLIYAEDSSGDRGLYALFQDLASRPARTRQGFLRAAFRHVIGRYLSARHPETATAFLRAVVRVLDDVSRQLDTRVDDFGDLGIHVLVRDGDRVLLLCGRSTPARIRTGGVVLPLSTDVAGVTELAIESARSQHDLFTTGVPESLVLFSIDAAADGSRADAEFFLGGTADDVSAVLDALDMGRSGSAGPREVDRSVHAVLYLTFPVAGSDRVTVAKRTPARARRPARPWLGAAAAIAIMGAAGVSWLALRNDPARAPGGGGESIAASQERPVPQQSRLEPDGGPDIANVEDASGAGVTPEGLSIAWERDFGEPVTSSPSLLGDAVVFGARDGHVYALDRESGERAWVHNAGGGVGASPVVRGDAVIAADYSGDVSRLAAGDGSVVWTRELRERVVSTPVVTRERVVVGTERGRVYALSFDTGRVLWRFGTKGKIRGSIAYADGVFYVPSHDGRLYALSEGAGAQRWSVRLGGPVASSPAVDGGRVTVGTAHGTIVALDTRTGGRVWSTPAGGAVNSAMLAADGRVFGGGGDGKVYCLDAQTGKVLWRFATGGAVLSKPYLEGGRLLVTSYDGSVYCLDASTGERVSRYATSEAIFSSPVVVDDRVYFGNNDGRFYCLNVPR